MGGPKKALKKIGDQAATRENPCGEWGKGGFSSPMARQRLDNEPCHTKVGGGVNLLSREKIRE